MRDVLLVILPIVVSCGGRLPDDADAGPLDASSDVVDATTQDAGDAEAPMGCVAKVAAGTFNTCAIDRQGALWCWGASELGQLGQGDGGELGCDGACANAPVRVVSLTHVIDVVVGEQHVCALEQDGSVWCSGYNGFGQLGNGTTTSASVPVQIATLKANALGTGNNHTCAITAGGLVSCWGFNLSSQLGDGTTSDQSSPVQVVSIANATEVQGGDLFTCARLSDGTAWCWGHGVWGERGDGTTTLTSPPVQVIDVADVTHIGASWDHACASESGGVACWGLPAPGDASVQPTPTNITGLVDVKGLAVGYDHTCALDGAGNVWCFGGNTLGQLGGSTQGGWTPVQVTLPSDITQIVAGDSWSCALRASGKVLCWGNNTYGQLGKGEPSPACDVGSTCERTPVAVLSSCP